MCSKQEYWQCTIYFLQRNLSKYMEVWAVQCPAEDPVDARVIGVQKGLCRHSIRYQPHAQEEQEEEHVFDLWNNLKTWWMFWRLNGCFFWLWFLFLSEMSFTILSTMMILGPSCLWMAKMWMSLKVKTMKSKARQCGQPHTCLWPSLRKQRIHIKHIVTLMQLIQQHYVIIIPAWQSHHEERDGHHVTFVPVILHI